MTREEFVDEIKCGAVFICSTFEQTLNVATFIKDLGIPVWDGVFDDADTEYPNLSVESYGGEIATWRRGYCPDEDWRTGGKFTYEDIAALVEGAITFDGETAEDEQEVKDAFLGILCTQT